MQNHNIVFVVGLGPGGARFLTAQARSALQQAEVLCGYTVYLNLVRPLFPEKETYSTGMTKELDRCRWALETARAGRAVALVCSGDAGVYGMASPLLELAHGLPGCHRGGGARADGGPLRRSRAGSPAGPRFLRHLSFGPAHPVGSHRDAAGLCRQGRFCAGTL